MRLHEITHMIQGTDAHSESGIMKARWDTHDYLQMERKPLSFTNTDILLIYRGLGTRNLRRGLTTDGITKSPDGNRL
jgi:hypothetical protein